MTPTRDQALAMLRAMIRIRRLEERCAEDYVAAKIRGFLHVYIGEEAVAAGVIPALSPKDAVIGTYREHAHALLRGMPANAIMAEMYGKLDGCSRGRGGSMHLFSRELRFYGGQAIVGGGLPLAIGLALADKMRGTGAITAVFFGDGASAEGVFHESLNLASLWRLPVLFVCENNRYAMGTALERHQSQTDLRLKAQSYDLPAEQVDGMDVLAVEAATRRAADAVRRGAGPSFIEFLTYRFRAHSMYDPELYRTKEEVAQWKRRDPLTTFETELRQKGLLDEADLAELERDVAADVAAAVAVAEAGPWEPAEDLMKDVCTPVTP